MIHSAPFCLPNNNLKKYVKKGRENMTLKQVRDAGILDDSEFSFIHTFEFKIVMGALVVVLLMIILSFFTTYVEDAIKLSFGLILLSLFLWYIGGENQKREKK